MAKTFSLDDPEQHLAYLEESALHWILYGGVYLGFDQESRTITLYEPDELVSGDGSAVVIS